MSTITQLCSSFKGKNDLRQPKDNTLSRARKLYNCPHRKGICKRVFIMKPKKPNSAIRKIARVRFSSGKTANCYIPGLGHNLREFSVVLVQGGGVKDLPGIQYHILRGRFDFGWKERINRQKKLTRKGIPKNDKRDDY